MLLRMCNWRLDWRLQLRPQCGTVRQETPTSPCLAPHSCCCTLGPLLRVRPAPPEPVICSSAEVSGCSKTCLQNKLHNVSLSEINVKQTLPLKHLNSKLYIIHLPNHFAFHSFTIKDFHTCAIMQGTNSYNNLHHNTFGTKHFLIDSY